MSDSSAPNGTAPIGGNLQDLVSTQKSGVKYLGLIVTLLQQIFPQINGTFTCAAAATTAVANTSVQAGCKISLTPRNAAAGTLIKNHGYYISTITPNVGFTFATADAASAAGSEIWDYSAANPV